MVVLQALHGLSLTQTSYLVGISINCLKTILTPCQPPVASHDWGGWQGVRTDAQAFLEIPWCVTSLMDAVLRSWAR